MRKYLSVLFLILFGANAFAESGAGVEGGLAYGDIGAEETGQRIANIAGSSVLVEYDRATWYGRLFYEYELTVRFHTFIRPEVKFSNFKELTKQIKKDVEKAKKYHQI